MTDQIFPADLRRFHCPVCKQSLGGRGYQATPEERKALGERTPQQGDTTVCLHCVAPLMFDGKGGIRLMTPLEVNALPKEDRDSLLHFTFFLMSR